ncbi:unnamed protein product [Didymodactylos carnosus]|uniref:EF-hand domain-containing protein n=1 Tax=Didymodactylos carnosus TaxID=1234261 RepID=A0A8S2HAA4_9BILA|nr:unnamed protein product [Didymodactylos carnosus]CAF3620095.1 unnamed protein product [Didymodactylos carnosus]
MMNGYPSFSLNQNGHQNDSSSQTNIHKAFQSRRKIEIDDEDLLILLNDSDLSRQFDHTKFSIEHCKLLISAVNSSLAPGLDKLPFERFKYVFELLLTWRNLFRRHDLDRNGIIETYALVNILNSLRFNLPPSTLEIIVKRYSTRHDGQLKICFEHYIQLCARLTLLNDLMQQKQQSNVDTNVSPRDVCSFSIDEFMQLALTL